jgi:hypothetical protein
MPNWTANSLKLTAKSATSEAKLAELVREISRSQEANDEPKFFNMIKPIPQPLQIVAGWSGDKVEQTKREAAEQLNEKIYGHKNWYDFCVHEWGTKWEPKLDENNKFELDGNVLIVYFDTAWSPPIPIYEALEAMGFEVEATYIECGMGFVGTYKNGQDITEDFDQFVSLDGEEDYEAIDKFFETRGFDHSPANFGG